MLAVPGDRACLSLSEAAAQPRKIVIDCDPGIDDAMAIILATQHPGLDIVGITTMFGNAYVDQATANALTVVELSGRTIPVYKGAARPLTIRIEPPPDFVHGKDGLGNTRQAAPRSAHLAKSAAQFLVDIAKAIPVRSLSWPSAGSRILRRPCGWMRISPGTSRKWS